MSKNTMKLSDAIDVIFSHNNRVNIWIPDKEDPLYSILVWDGMAHKIPQKYLDSKDWVIEGDAAKGIDKSRHININIYDVDLDKVDQAVLDLHKELKGGNKNGTD